MNQDLNLKYQPRDYQTEMLMADKRFKICVWHRRSGKSITALNQQMLRALKIKGSYYYFLPTYKSAKQVVWDSLVDEFIPKEVIEKKNESELAIYYKNGSIQRFCGCEDIDKHRGINPIDVVFDEYSEIKEEMWTAIIQPVLRENKGSATFIFTPKGKNHSWKLLQMAKDSEDWFWSVKGVADTNALEESEIEAAKREMPQMLFQQEFECSFIDDAGAFFRRIRDNVWIDRKFEDSKHKFQLGVDLAKYVDWTVITPFNLVTFCAYFPIRFNQIDYNLQKSRIESESLRYDRNGKPTIWVDSTGVGDPILEDLQRMGLKAEGFKFTENSRKQLLENLAILLEQDKIKIPNDEGLISELESMRYELGDRGKLHLKVPDGMTDDRIMSLALAVWDVKQHKVVESELDFINKYRNKKSEDPYGMFRV